jgi:hypothetical protein
LLLFALALFNDLLARKPLTLVFMQYQGLVVMVAAILQAKEA